MHNTMHLAARITNTPTCIFVHMCGCIVVKLQDGLLKCVCGIVRAYSGNRQLQATMMKRCQPGNPTTFADKPVNGERIAFDTKGRGYLLCIRIVCMQSGKQAESEKCEY